MNIKLSRPLTGDEVNSLVLFILNNREEFDIDYPEYVSYDATDLPFLILNTNTDMFKGMAYSINLGFGSDRYSKQLRNYFESAFHLKFL